jgi:mono/diheme cytochrome c family protein
VRAVLVAAAALLAPAASAYGPETNYAIHCQGCHLADGSATEGKVPALAGSVACFLRAPGGRAYLVRVPGVANAPLADAELAALLEWTLARFDAASIPPDHTPYTAEEVGRWRREPLVDVSAERARLLGADGVCPR